MKQFFILALFVLAHSIAFSQAPLGINYQGVARNAQGQAIANQSIKIKISLIKEDDVNVKSTFYSETRTVTTNALGLFSFTIGVDPSTNSGFLNQGNWNDGNSKQFLKVELDVNNSGTWTDMGTQQIVSVPYALYATEAARARELSTPLTAFAVSSTASQSLTSNFGARLKFESAETGSRGFDLTNNEFIPPAVGWYHFNFSVTASYTVTNTGSFLVDIRVNGNSTRTFRTRTTGLQADLAGSTDLYLNYGDKVSLYVFNLSTGTTATVGGDYTYFTGHAIR
ncbi:hypothetical protein HRG84_19350 [Flavisolibacter sp. BT320]|nr:hypothetical protein [Flavisolibacter longurius]